MKRQLILILALTAVASCEVGPSTTPFGLPGTIVSGTWYMNTANDSTLPVMISERRVGVTLEQVFLDSAQLTVYGVGGAWDQRYWIRVNHSGIEDRKEVVLDIGTYAANGAAYAFTSSVRARVFALTVRSPFALSTVEPMVAFTDSTPVRGFYRGTRP